MFKNLIQNLSKNQKVGIAIIMQVIVIVIIVACVQWAIQPETHIEVVNENDTAIPDERWRGIKNEIWHLIKNNVSDVSQSAIDDAVIREGTYS